MPLADLHTHTNCSDGRLSPEALVEKAARHGLAALAITDHDSVDAYPLAVGAAQQHGIELISGVELSAWLHDREVHLLGYGFDPASPEVHEHLERYQADRVARARAMVERLAELGVPVRWERVTALAGRGAIGRPHVARALVEARHVDTVTEAFDRFLTLGAPAYVAKPPVASADLIALVHRAGGVCSLAHPGAYVSESVLLDLIDAGLDGVEVVHPSHDEMMEDYWTEVAQRYGLLATGGSDYHGVRPEEDERLGSYGVPYARIRRLRRAA
jgi:3',5'-nucleoside bisphosphate phosphatase